MKTTYKGRLNCNQVAYLELEYLKDQAFSSERILRLAKAMGLNRQKVYKWVWDRRSKKTRPARLYQITSSHAEIQKMAQRAIEQRDSRPLLALHFEQAIIALEEDRVVPLVKDEPENA